MCGRMGDTKILFKCATAVTLCAARGGSPFRAFPSQCVCVVDRKNRRHLASARLTCMYRGLLKKAKQARVGQIMLSGILPVFANRIQGYRNSKRMAVNGMVEQLCNEEEVGYVDLWDSLWKKKKCT